MAAFTAFEKNLDLRIYSADLSFLSAKLLKRFQVGWGASLGSISIFRSLRRRSVGFEFTRGHWQTRPEAASAMPWSFHDLRFGFSWPESPRGVLWTSELSHDRSTIKAWLVKCRGDGGPSDRLSRLRTRPLELFSNLRVVGRILD